ncbi:metabotropic glutamate receptor 7 [Biomphalaria pfeifferi]|uniref:Metabotropic glutamate receptor 7 n=1 Tax=Biomphalaria pfeifferi TaxID=112525 RepID=A0AAD8AXG7_BIOPF|nr:metabotropic glutamate receptor 7 [Biomphalaria pfeifferi]
MVHACGHEVVDFYRIDMVESLVYFLRKANQRYLLNVKLGFVIVDACNKESTSALQALRFLPMSNLDYNTEDDQYNGSQAVLKSFNVVGVIGTDASFTTRSAAVVLRTAKIPMISFRATSNALAYKVRFYASALGPPPTLWPINFRATSNAMAMKVRFYASVFRATSNALANKVPYPNFYRTKAREADIVLALLRFMEANGWLYFTVVYSNDDQYLAMMMHLERNMGQRCIERVFMVNYKTNMTTVVEQLNSGRFSPRVAVPLLNTYFCKAIANEVRRLGKDCELLWIGLDTCMNMMFNRETPMGSVGVSYTGIDFTDNSFVEYLAQLNFETKNHWFPAILKHMKCSSIECYHDMLREKYHTNPSQTLLIKLAVYGLVRTLSEFMEEHCPDTLSDKISCFNQQSSQFASFFKEIATDSEMRDAYLYNNQGQVIFLQWNPNAENEMIGLMSYNLFEQTIRRINDLDVMPF